MFQALHNHAVAAASQQMSEALYHEYLPLREEITYDGI